MSNTAADAPFGDKQLLERTGILVRKGVSDVGGTVVRSRVGATGEVHAWFSGGSFCRVGCRVRAAGLFAEGPLLSSKSGRKVVPLRF